MKKLFILLCLLYSGSLYAACTGGVADTCSLTDVQECYTEASEGDTITIPAGTCTWSSQLSISKSIKIQGATACSSTGTPGAADYVITCDDATLITGSGSNRLISISVVGDKSIDISGLTLDGNNNSTYNIYVANSSTTPLRNLRLHGNEFRDCNNINIGTDGEVFALVDHNKFNDNLYDFKFLANNATSWLNFPGIESVGSNNYFYMEDNYSIGMYGIIISSGEGARWVYRYNTVDGAATGPGDKFFDAHGDTRNRGVVAFEIYENTINHSQTRISIDYRGGTGIIFNNTEDGNNSFTFREEKAGCNACADGYPYCSDSDCQPPDPMIGCGDSINNGYVWNNIDSIGITDISESDAATCISENTSWFDDYGTGDTNFTYGTTLPGTCTVNDAYYDTDAEHGSGYDTGELYRCTATNTWTWVYSPYKYPHDLQKASVTIPSGTVVPGIVYEIDIKTGGTVISVTAIDDTFVVLDNTIRAAIVAGLDSTSISDTDFSSLIESDTGSWSATGVVRISANELQITLPAAPLYSLAGGVEEVITVNLPASAMTSGNALSAGNFTIYGQTEGTVSSNRAAIEMLR